MSRVWKFLCAHPVTLAVIPLMAALILYHG